MSNPVASALPNPASYDSSVAGVVTDTVTGLTWEQTAAPDTYDQLGIGIVWVCRCV